MERWIVWRPDLWNACWECDGGGDANLWQVYAESPMKALQLVRESIHLATWDEPAELHCVSLGSSRARKARLLRPSEWLADGSLHIDPPDFEP